MSDKLTEFKRRALVEGTVKLLQSNSHFSICDFDTLTELAGVNVPKQVQLSLRALHCVKYADMDKETLKMLIECVMEVLRQNPTFPADFKVRVDEMSKQRHERDVKVGNFFTRLLLNN